MTHDSSGKLSIREKVGYSLGDAATNFFFMSMILYQQKFYTDTVGIAASTVGWMFILVRWADAIFDPIIGALADRTNTRWGKFRPWIFFTALPFGLIFWFAYTTPDWGSSGKLVYAAVTYVLLMMMYSANNTPYSALLGVMTPNASERTSVSTYRFVSAMIGQFLIQGLAGPLVDKFGEGNSAKGWSITMAIFGSVMVVCYLITFATTRERVLPNPNQKKAPIKSDLADVFSCKPWVVMFLLTLFVFTTLSLRGGSNNYLFTYYLNKTKLMEVLQSLGLTMPADGVLSGIKIVLNAFGLIVKPDGSNASSVAFSCFLMMGNLVTIVGVLVSKPLSDRFGKKAIFTVGLSLTALVQASVFLIKPDDVYSMYLVGILWPLCYGPTVPLLWVMIADVADYSEWKTSRRATGFVYAGILFALKAGLGVGGALGGWLLAGYGYVPKVAQTEHALLGIRLCASIYAAIPFGLGVICLIVYPIGKALNRQLQEELTARRKTFAPAQS